MTDGRRLDVGMTLGRRLCEHWGLDADRVRSITIDITAQDVPHVVVELLADDATAELITGYYLLVPPERARANSE